MDLVSTYFFHGLVRGEAQGYPAAFLRPWENYFSHGARDTLEITLR